MVMRINGFTRRSASCHRMKRNMTEKSNTQPQVRDLVITSAMQASPETIWRAFTDPAQLVKFFGPTGTTIDIASVTVEPRVGGQFKLVMSLNGSDTKFPMNAVYKVFEPNQRMVFETEGGITGTIELTDLGNGETELKWSSRTAFDDELFKNATTGTNSAIDQLAVHLAEIQA